MGFGRTGPPWHSRAVLNKRRRDNNQVMRAMPLLAMPEVLLLQAFALPRHDLSKVRIHDLSKVRTRPSKCVSGSSVAIHIPSKSNSTEVKPSSLPDRT